MECQMLGFVRMGVGYNPAGCPFPDGMQDTRARAQLAIYGRRTTPDHRLHPLEKFRFNVSKVSDFHEQSLSSSYISIRNQGRWCMC